MPRMHKSKPTESPAVRMSEIDRSFNSCDTFKNAARQMAPTGRAQSDCEVSEMLRQELDDVDFKRFVDDLSLNVLADAPATKSCHRPATSRIVYERTERKETIIIDSLPKRGSDDVRVVKVKITVPKDRQRPTIAVQPTTGCTSTFKRHKRMAAYAHHLPIMGQAALMSKRRHCERLENDDSEIVKELVTQRFRDCLLHCYEKSFHRQSSRARGHRDVSPEANSGPEPPQSTSDDDLRGISSIGSESASSASRSGRFPSTYSVRSHATTQPDGRHLGSVGCLTDDMKFLLSTDALNVETTDEINANHSTFAQYSPLAKSSTGTLEETLEYDATQFLKDALGDELNRYYSTDASYMNSIGTSNVSALISKADTQECSNTIYEDSVRTSEYDYYPFNKRVGELLADSNVQYQVILQTSKALGFCRSTKEFSASEEELAAERILLLASCKRDAIRDEIRRLEYDETPPDAAPNNFGCVRITQIVLPPKRRGARIFDAKNKRKFADWYVCVLGHGTTVLATAAARPDGDGFVRLRDEIAFDQLRPDFEIRIALYTLRARSPKRTLSHESKYHLESDATLCPLSPPRIFAAPRRYKTATTPRATSEKSSYAMCGRYTLRIGDVGRFGHFKMSHHSSPTLEGDFVMDFGVGVNVRETCSGFLDVGLENGETIAWNRRWCALCDGALRYHNHPGEEDPLGVVDLRCCATAAISSADRQICARPRTLLVEVFTRVDDARTPRAIIKYFLAADSKQYMEMWANKLNSTVSALRTWNALKCAPAKR